jgi:hypothetical protein
MSNGASIIGTSAGDSPVLEGTAEVEGHRPGGPYIEGQQILIPKTMRPTWFNWSNFEFDFFRLFDK